MNPTNILDQLDEKTLVLVYNAKLAKESQILGLLQILAGPTGLADIQVHRPGHQLMVTLTYRSAEIKQQLFDLPSEREKKTSTSGGNTASHQDPPTKQHEAEVDINRLHILMPRGMSKEEAIDILAECGPIDHLDFVAMGPLKNITYRPSSFGTATEEGATRAKSVGTDSEEKSGTLRGKQYRHRLETLPKWFHCILLWTPSNLLRRRRDHDAICARQNGRRRRELLERT
ncbi:unnamed protein product [Trichogramma brassicae]|uniref:Uncharacterized protein n=1 Tax=Trichogramma brassicae TaxID=86971 RepID=A0A6H5I1E7_9HYME|nr:unnamed protein product [Trichogramma brassicae]